VLENILISIRSQLGFKCKQVENYLLFQCVLCTILFAFRASHRLLEFIRKQVIGLYQWYSKPRHQSTLVRCYI